MAVPSFMSQMGGTSTSTTGAPRRGQGAYGLVPGDIAVPENVWSQLGRAVPNFGSLSKGASDIATSEQSGELSPQTLQALQRGAAEFGISSGMPGSGITASQLLGNIAGFSENRQRQGLQDYESLTSLAAPLQTDPRLAADISERNALFDAAPDPQAAAQQQLQEWMNKFMLTRSGTGGGGFSPGGGTWYGRQPQVAGYAGSMGTATHGFQNPELTNPAALSSGGEGYWSNGTYITPAGAGGVPRPTPFDSRLYGGGGVGGTDYDPASIDYSGGEDFLANYLNDEG